MKIKVGDKLPDSKVFILSEGSPKEISLKHVIGEGKVILFGLPGAFTPTCSAKHLPGFINSMDKLKKKGIEKIICISVNDPFVMDAWGKEHNVQEKIKMLGDSKGEFAKSIGAEMDLSARGLGIRSQRYTMLIESGVVQKVTEEEIAGKCELTSAENFIKQI